MLIVPILLALLPAALSLSLSSVMEMYDKQHCFYANVEDPRATVHFYYSESVTKLTKAATGAPPVKLQVFGPSGELLQDHPSKNVMETTLMPGRAGQFAFCLQHDSSRPVRRVIDIDLSETLPEAAAAGKRDLSITDDPKDALSIKLDRTNSKLRHDLEDLLHTQKYIKNREKRNMETVEETNSRVFYFSVIECLLVVAMAVGQVYVMRRLFGTSSRPRV